MTRRTLLEAAALLALTTLAAAGTYFYHPHKPALYMTQEATPEGEISIGDARAAMVQPGVIWIDARTRAQFDKGHVPTALLVSKHETDFESLLLPAANAIQDGQDKLVIVYCDAKKCEASHHVADVIRGFHPIPEQVRVLHGGWAAWQSATP